MAAKAIDQYIQARSEEHDRNVDPQLRNIIEGIFHHCIEQGEYRQVWEDCLTYVRPLRSYFPNTQAVGIALEAHRLDVIEQIYSQTKDSSLLSYAMDAVLDNHFSLSYRDEVLNFLYRLFPSPTSDSKSPHIHSLTRLLVTLSSPSLTTPLLVSLVPKEKLLAYQLAFDLAEGGAQDFLEAIRTELPEGEEVRRIIPAHGLNVIDECNRKQNPSSTLSGRSLAAKNLSSCILSSSSVTTKRIY